MATPSSPEENGVGIVCRRKVPISVTDPEEFRREIKNKRVSSGRDQGTKIGLKKELGNVLS